MLTIIEQHDIILNFSPDLGLGYIFAGCKKQGIKTSLIHGSIRYLKDILVNDVDKLISLIKNFETEIASSEERLAFDYLSNLLVNLGQEDFKNYLVTIYEKTKSDYLGDYLNHNNQEDLTVILYKIMTLLRYYISKRNDRTFFVENLFRDIMQTKPSMIAFSMWDLHNVFIRETINLIKKKTDIPVVIGGPFSVHYTPEKIFATINANFIIKGLSESALPNLYKNYKQSSQIKSPNIIQKFNGKILINKEEPVKRIEDIQDPDFSKFDLDLYYSPFRTLPIQTSRGCPWKKCAFCSHHAIYGGKYSTLGINEVIKLLKSYKKKYGVNFVHFHDELISPSRFKLLSKEIINNGLDSMRFYAYARPEKGFTKEVLNYMHKAGFRALFFGVESGSQRVLDLMVKGTNVKDSEVVLKNAFDAGFANLIWVIFGFPGETKKDAEETVDFLERNSQYIDFYYLQNFKIEKDSPIEKNPELWGVFGIQNSNYEVKEGMSQREADEFVQSLVNKINIEEIIVRNERFLADNHQFNRHLVFLQSCFEKIPKNKTDKLFFDKSIANYFPLFVGLVDITNSLFFIKPKIFSPERKMEISVLEKEICFLCDGSKPLKQIFEELKKAHDLSFNELISFIRDLSEKNFIHFLKKNI